MGRRNLAQILKDAKIDIRKEYDRLYYCFYMQKFFDGYNNVTLEDCCRNNFLSYPFRGTCLTLDDFDECYEMHFEKVPNEFSIDYLVSFCEYTYNMVIYLNQMNTIGMMGQQMPSQVYCAQIYKVIDKIGYMYINDTDMGVTIFVPKSADMLAVAEIVAPKLSYKVIEYNHYTMKGDIEKKKAILHLFADELEHEGKKLGSINSTLKTNVFILFNNMNIRHDNCSEDSPHYIEYVANMPKKDLESWYDETYQLCLLAFLELDNVERNKKLAELKNYIGKGK